MKTVEVKCGDTLWSIAGEHLGDHYKWPKLYALNEAVISKAQARRWSSAWPGRRPYRGPDWIFPGTILVLPEPGERR